MGVMPNFKEQSEKEYEIREVGGEATVVLPNGGMSSHLPVDYSLMPNVQFIEDVVEVLTKGCTEHGGKYPRDNWRKLPIRDNMVHALRHCLTLHGLMLTGCTEEQLMTELTHAVCRLWFVHEQVAKYGVNPNYTPKPPLGKRIDLNYETLGDK